MAQDEQGEQKPRPAAPPVRRLGRTERREQILAAATCAFARAGGFAATGLDEVAAEAGITRMILYRHFESKTDLYRAVIDRAAARLYAATTDDGELGAASVPGMMNWAASDESAFRLLFQHAVRESDFRHETDQVRASMTSTLHPHLSEIAATDAWADWGTHLATATVIQAITAWLDAGQPDPDEAPDRILRAISGIYQAVRPHHGQA